MEKEKVPLTSEAVIEKVFEEILKKSTIEELKNEYRAHDRHSDSEESCECGHYFEKAAMIIGREKIYFFSLGNRSIKDRGRGGCSRKPARIILICYTVKKDEENVLEKFKVAIWCKYPHNENLKIIMEGDADQPLTLNIDLPKVRPLNFTDARLKKDTKYKEELVKIITQCLLKEAGR